MYNDVINMVCMSYSGSHAISIHHANFVLLVGGRGWRSEHIPAHFTDIVRRLKHDF